MIRQFLLIVSLVFIQITSAYAFDPIRVNNRLITSDWIPTVNKNISKAQAETIVLHVFNEAKRHKIDPLLLLAIIRSESTFNSNARSSEGARGLMQVLPRWHRDKIRGRNINDVKVNIEVGTTIINDCLNKYNDNVNRALGCYLGDRSAEYVAKISATHRELKQILVTQMFVREQPITVLSDFNKPRHYHTQLAELEYRYLMLALNGGSPDI